ncbi:MAG: hypothetical protein HY874_09595 [Chloroflexi bacterium]|nr:hypothetical protein [Chloroflexota bacterium]
MSAEQRLNRLYPALTAKERGLLVLHAYKTGEQPDSLIYSTAPSSQGREFNRYIRMMNAVNIELAAVLFVLRERVGKLDLKFAWLQTVYLWGMETSAIGDYLNVAVKEPITASEYAPILAAARAKFLPLDQCAEAATEEHPFLNDEYVTGDDGEPLIAWPAWDRVEAEKRADLERLVADGTIAGRKRGKSLSLNAGSFYDWLDRPVPAVTKGGALYDVHRDQDADEVASLRRGRALIERVIDKAPARLGLPLDLEAPIEPWSPAGGYGDSLGRALALGIRDGLQIHWRELRASEIGVQEVAEEFGGEDPLKPDTRALLDGCLASCGELRDQMADYVEIELTEPAEDDVAQVRMLIERVVEKG